MLTAQQAFKSIVYSASFKFSIQLSGDFITKQIWYSINVTAPRFALVPLTIKKNICNVYSRFYVGLSVLPAIYLRYVKQLIDHLIISLHVW